MADAHEHIRASEHIYTVAGTFDIAFEENKRVAIGVEIESSLFATGVLKFAKNLLFAAKSVTPVTWKGYSSEL
jgi:hypothetical protein